MPGCRVELLKTEERRIFVFRSLLLVTQDKLIGILLVKQIAFLDILLAELVSAVVFSVRAILKNLDRLPVVQLDTCWYMAAGEREAEPGNNSQIELRLYVILAMLNSHYNCGL